MVELLGRFEDVGVGYWVDGGWGVDCLLGEQTRPHGDLDLVLPRPDLPVALELLTGLGYQVIRDLMPTAIALRSPDGIEVDLHPVDPTTDGGGDQLLDDGTAWHYGPAVLGSIGGRPVPCVPAAEQIAMRHGYPVRDIDHHDVRRLAARFAIEPPDAFS